MTLLVGEDRARGSTLAKCWLMWCCWRRCLSVGGRRREGSWAASWAGASCALHLLPRKSLPVLVRPTQHPAALTGHGRVACESLTDTERYAGAIPPPSSLGRTDGSVTLVEGQTFCVSDRTGDVRPNQPHGLFVLDTRVLSRWELLIDGHPLESLTVDVPEPFTALFVGRALPPAGQVDSDVIAFPGTTRSARASGSGSRSPTTAPTAVDVEIELRCDVDFADLFEVKERRVVERIGRRHETTAHGLVFAFRDGSVDKTVELRTHDRAHSGRPHAALDDQARSAQDLDGVRGVHRHARR